jgi:anti-sigma regulatory factor (Ser/Thr protein kinase)
MSAAAEKHREAARDLLEDSLFRPFRTDAHAEIIAAALANAEREGLKRAAEIVAAHDWPYTNTRDPMSAVQEAAVNQVCHDIRATILSEAGEDE